jgi:AcrR family transcriptional regulator
VTDIADRTDAARPPSQRREQTRARLLDAAHEVFSEVGMDAASVEAICERAGFTRGAFYSNFETKDELFLALVTRLSDAKLDAVESRVQRLSPMARSTSPISSVISEPRSARRWIRTC